MRGKKIIIAEASSTIKSVADSLLRQQGYDVVCTSDGLQAWEVMQAERPDLALIGLNLSGISGLELCRQMSGDKVAEKIPALLMIGARDKATKDQLVASGARGYLKKPFSPKDLLEAIANIIGPLDEPESARPESNAKNRTSYRSEIMSSTDHLESEPEQVQNINWTDLNTAANATRTKPQKVASLDIGATNDGVMIEEDQFGLTNNDFQKGEFEKENNKLADDEDYNWFIGEIKKEVEGRVEDAAGATKDRKQRPILSANNQTEDKLRFDDLATAKHGSGISNESDIDVASVPSGDKKGVERSTTVLSDIDIERIADKIAERLAVLIVNRIDRKALIEAIKMTLKP